MRHPRGVAALLAARRDGAAVLGRNAAIATARNTPQANASPSSTHNSDGCGGGCGASAECIDSLSAGPFTCAESSGSFGAEDSELVGTASVFLPPLLEGLSLEAPR